MSLHDRPTALELLEAVREFLETDVLTVTEGQVRFHTRVAINALAMVQRELAAGDAPAQAHADRLARLGYADDAALAAALRAGECDDVLGEVAAVLHPAVEAKLAVANPNWFAGAEPGGGADEGGQAPTA